MMEQSFKEENIEKKNAFCIDRYRIIAIKWIQKSVIRNHKKKIRLFSISVFFFKFRFIYKTMAKQTVHLDYSARKSGSRLQFLRQSVL